ncbi:MAG: transcriptional regulator [Bacteroidetes bacterium RIFCSPLOWO2_12_FULL_31_6]|nr:MAG: transcriptional regulator [Bacteroidetes bacterium RIFCSPLOWO2_12_FULL_31_6]
MKIQKALKTKIELYVIDKTREMRTRGNISQAELAFRLGVSPGFIGKVESKNSSSKYNLNHINKLSEIFNCNPKTFLPDKKL